jgi:eukaryotic-like serine/threonine-protein kinase
MADSIAHYRIGAKLGQGGMGEVYRATDTKLGRDVALKVIAPALAEDPVRLAGVSREAQVLASLNHPNIAAVYGIEDHAIVMELVEGPTLADRLKHGPLPLDDALAIARQIAAGLEAAHERGIVHRDLKPGNIKITADGTIKLLDFGLAKHAALAAQADDMTMAASISGVGSIVGTPAYMAPEQVRGKAVDQRVDIWAFGVVIYEMLTGAKLFEGDNTTDVMASVVTKEPDLSLVPASVRPMLRRCLEKDPKKRLRDVSDAMLLLDATSEAPVAAVVQPRSSRMPMLAVSAGAAVLAVALALVSFVHFRETVPVAPVVRFSTGAPQDVTLTPLSIFALSPDGQKLAFPAIGPDGRAHVWIRAFDAATAHALNAEEIPPSIETMFWSPDSRSVAYIVGAGPQPHLDRVDIGGSPAQKIADVPPGTISGWWDKSGVILLGSVRGITKVSASGGTPVAVTEVDQSRKEASHLLPVLLPDGRHFLYSRGGGPGTRAVFVGSLDAKPKEQPTKPLLTTDYGATFVSDPHSRSSRDGFLLFIRDTTLMAQRFDASTQTLQGDATALADQIAAANGTGGGLAFYSVSERGVLAYRTGRASTLTRQLVWLDREGKRTGVLSELGSYGLAKLSPDGTHAVTTRLDAQTGNNADIWVNDLTVDTSMRITFDPGADVQPVWSPDGKQVAWARQTPDSAAIYRKAADGSGAEELLYKFGKPTAVGLTDWTRDGRFLVYQLNGDIWALPIGPGTDSSRQPIAVIQTPASELGAYVSADTRWVAYISNESGRQEIYVQPFAPGWQAAGATSVGGKWMVSRGAQGMIRWRADGKELLFLDGDGNLMSVDVTSAPVFKAGPPHALFQFPREFLAQSRNPGTLADVSRDHQRFLLVMPPLNAARSPEISVVLNWPTLLMH